MTKRIEDLFPGCPPREAAAIAEHTAVRGSGRVGRTAAGRNLEEQALALAVAAAVRHRHTEYDALLPAGLDRPLARQRVADRVDEILAAWRKYGGSGSGPSAPSAHAPFPGRMVPRALFCPQRSPQSRA